MLDMKAVCPKNASHQEFFATAHVTQTWRVDEKGNFLSCYSTDQTTHTPSHQDVWCCAECGATAEMVDESADKRWVSRALRKALVDYDRCTILEIVENEEGGWGNGCEVLNATSIDTVREVLDTIPETVWEKERAMTDEERERLA